MIQSWLRVMSVGIGLELDLVTVLFSIYLLRFGAFQLVAMPFTHPTIYASCFCACNPPSQCQMLKPGGLPRVPARAFTRLDPDQTAFYLQSQAYVSKMKYEPGSCLVESSVEDRVVQSKERPLI